MGVRKVHNHETGYVAELVNPHVPGRKVVIYEAETQGLDVGDQDYAVVCDAHGTIAGCSDIRLARQTMKAPENFCDGCREIQDKS